jgi:inosine-uridine nucleoside N-ribohydrolase
MIHRRLVIAVLFSGMLVLPLHAQAPERIPVLFDTDIGSDIDDAFALALLLARPELDLRGVTSVGRDTQTRALLLCRFLTMTGRRHIPVAAGADPQPPRDLGGQYQYYYHPDVIFNRTTRPVKEPAAEFLYSRLRGQPRKVTIVATGPLTNVARLLADRPDCKVWIERLILTGAPTNFRADVKAAQTVFGSGVPLVVVPPDVTAGLTLDREDLKKVFAPGTALSLQVQALYQLWDRESPPLADVLTASLCIDERFCTFEPRHLEVDEEGHTRIGKGKPNARVATAVKREDFKAWYVGRMASCLPPAKVPVELLPRGGMPNRVHVAEDFETDIERRWWMCGKVETRDLPPGSSRAVRGVLTHDFDDLLGNPRAMYTAVIFNPVPGPPMGKKTRLGFRYHLKGTDTLRVQIYSLTNGYHRHLVLKGLPQEKWEEATVDMTKARRPDGTGGPLSEGERVDDIQFYTDPAAELLIDDIVLFDAAVAGEKRPFPKRIHFTGVFDTGKQGKEWPGDFEIAQGKGYFWHAARSVENRASGAPWIRLHLRGPRPLGEAIRLSFRYRLTGADGMIVTLLNGAAKVGHPAELQGLQQGVWAEATVDFGKTTGDKADEIHFTLPKGAELLVDDVLLYEAP